MAGRADFLLPAPVRQRGGERRSGDDRRPGRPLKCNPLAVRRPGWRQVGGAAEGEAGSRAAGQVEYPDVGLGISPGHGQPLALGGKPAPALLKTPPRAINPPRSAAGPSSQTRSTASSAAL